MMVFVTHPPVPGPMDAPGDLSARCGREPCAGNLVHRVAFRAQQDADEGSVQLPVVMPTARVYSTRTAAHARGFTLIEVLIASVETDPRRTGRCRFDQMTKVIYWPVRGWARPSSRACSHWRTRAVRRVSASLAP